MWGIGYLAAALAQARETHDSLGISVWIVLGWLVGLVYSFLVWGAAQLVRWLRRKPRESSARCET